MSVESAVARGRVFAEREMTLTLTAYEPNGFTTNGDGYKVPTFTSHGTVMGKVQSPSSSSRDTATRYVTIGEVERPVLEAGLHIPISATIPVPGKDRGKGWEYQVTALGEMDDASLAGRRYLVFEVPAKSKATARRLNVVEL